MFIFIYLRKDFCLTQYIIVSLLFVLTAVVLFLIFFFGVFPALVINGIFEKLFFNFNKKMSIIQFKDLDQCDSKHESYSLTSASILGNYTNYAVAVDSKYCSIVGK